MFEALIKRLNSKTYIAALVMSVLTVLEVNLNVLIPLLPVATQPYAPLMWAIIMLIMRELTKEPISAK